MAEEFVGSGWSFPLKLTAAGSIGLVSHDEELRQAVRLILGTAYGERPMRPEFGCGIHDLVFAPANATTAGEAAYEVRRSLERWEPRVEVDNVDVTFDQSDQARMYISITYRVKGANDPRNLVFPFYRIPTEEESLA
jgi:phage baseplate assembly protein W